ncbi:MAG: Ig-like domain-containing protein, partial [Clostridia bacterium]|nr:Ig-like domain-containing protein [Clostridia bacterium]
MNKKKILSILLSVMLVMSLALVFVACGDADDGEGDGAVACASCVDTNRDLKCDVCQGAVACTDHRDENADFYCDFCNDDFTKICRNHINENTNGRCDICGRKMKIDITLFVADQYGNPMSGIGLTADNSDDDPYEVMTNAEGKARLNLFDGTYRITFDPETVPDGYLPYANTVTIDTKEQVVQLELVNNIPNGESSRPYVIDSDTESETLPASGRYYYIIYHASSRLLKLDGENFVVVYNGNEYIPEGGTVTIELVEVESNEQS